MTARPCLLALLLLPGAVLGQAIATVEDDPARRRIQPAPTLAELQARHDAVLTLMKHPPVSGVLVGELMPRSVGGYAGLRPGDIILEYDQRRLDRPEQQDRSLLLREAIAAAVAEGAARRGIVRQVHMLVWRAGEKVRLEPEREPLGITALPCDIHVPLPANPVATERGSFALEWAAGESWYHVAARGGDYAAQRTRTELGRLATHEVQIRPAGAGDPVTLRVEFRATDRLKTYGFTIESLDFTDGIVTTSIQRRGPLLRGTLRGRSAEKPTPVERPTVPEAAPALLVPALAAALPQRADVVLPLALLSEVDLQTRLGYALETRGKARCTIADAAMDAFAVRLWHLGQVEATYYFTADRQLLKAEYDHGTTLRAASQKEALEGRMPTRAK